MFNTLAQRTQRMRWQILLMGIVTLAVLALSFILTFRRASAAEMLPLSIQSGQMADYSADNFSSQLAAVDISIIESALKDNRSGNVPEKLATIQSALKTPVPSVTPSPTVTPTATPTTGGPGATQPGASTKTPTTSAPPTQGPSVTPGGPTLTATVIQPPSSTPLATQTAAPSVTPGGPTVTATNTMAPSPTATSTNPGNKPTMPPGQIPSATQTATSIPSNTPTPSIGFGFPTATATAKIPPGQLNKTATAAPTNSLPPSGSPATAIPTNTPVPTATSTPLACSPAGSSGYVQSSSPSNGAVGIDLTPTISIYFNQRMDYFSIQKQVKLSGKGKLAYSMFYNPDKNLLEIKFIEPLKPNSTYEVKISKNLENSCGVRQGKDISFQFTTK